MPENQLRRPTTSAAEVCVILNAGSGSGKRSERVEALKAAAARHAARIDLRVVGQGRDIASAAERAVAEGFSTVAAAGGDGTVCAVAAPLSGTDCRLGIVPLGTFNFFARALDIPLETDPAVDVLVDGTERRVDVGEVNGQIFINNASLGMYAAVLQRRESVYRRWGRSRLAAYWSVLSVLARFRRPLTLRVSVDGEVRRFSTPMAFVANNAYQLEQFGLPGADCIRDGRFALFIAPDCGRGGLIRYALRLAFRSVEPDRDFELMCGRDIVVETLQRRRLVARDGERARMTGPFRFSHRPEALRVVVPARTPPAPGEEHTAVPS